MSRSLSYLRRGLLGIAFVGSLGFGATQAFAEPQGDTAARLDCRPLETLCVCEDGTETCLRLPPGQPCPVC